LWLRNMQALGGLHLCRGQWDGLCTQLR
jgi:hypothetical protein